MQFRQRYFGRGTKETNANVSVDEETSLGSSQDLGIARDGLDRRLLSPQIFMIALSGIIGITIFATMGSFIHTAGPAGLLTAIFYVGATAICVMEGQGELTVQWPISNAIVQYVRTFVDKELGIAIGLVYWYSWSSVVSVMLVGAAKFSTYWDFSTTGRVIVFYIVCPIVIICVNWIGVFWYGIVEGIGGLLKLLFVIGGALFLIGEGTMQYGSRYVNQGYQNDPRVAHDRLSAVLLIIPFLTYGFLGVEFVSVTGFEAKNPRTDLKFSAKWIAYVITILFLLCGVGECLNTAWNDGQLPLLETREDKKILDDATLASNDRTFSILVTAANNAGHHRLAGFFNGCLIFSCLSAANTALYVASRMVYGLVHDTKAPEWLLPLAKLNKHRVPIWGLVVSIATWVWLPFLQLKKGYSVESFISVIITIGSVGTVLVWASLCLAYIRYYHWLRSHKDKIKEWRHQDPNYWKKYDRWMGKNNRRYYSLCSELQPVPAYLGFTSCCLIVFVFTSATMWSGRDSRDRNMGAGLVSKRFFTAYGGTIVCVLLTILFKVINRNPKFGQKLEYNPQEFRNIIDEFETNLFLRDEDVPVPMQLQRRTTTEMLEADNATRPSVTTETVGGTQGYDVNEISHAPPSSTLIPVEEDHYRIIQHAR